MRQLKETVQTGASRQAVWEVLADFGGVANWAPGMRRSSLKGKQETGVGASRVMRHAWGFCIEETITRWTDGVGYSFKLTRAPFPMCEVEESWLTGNDGDGTVVTTTVSYNMRLGVLGTLLDVMLVRFLVRREMQAGMAGLMKHLEQKTANKILQ